MDFANQILDMGGDGGQNSGEREIIFLGANRCRGRFDGRRDLGLRPMAQSAIQVAIAPFDLEHRPSLRNIAQQSRKLKDTPNIMAIDAEDFIVFGYGSLIFKVRRLPSYRT